MTKQREDHPNGKDSKNFDAWLLQIGNGITADGHSTSLVQVPIDILVQNQSDTIDAIVKAIYPDLLDKYSDEDYLSKRAILAPKNNIVSEINSKILEKLPSLAMNYFSSYSIYKASLSLPDEGNHYPP